MHLNVYRGIARQRGRINIVGATNARPAARRPRNGIAFRRNRAKPRRISVPAKRYTAKPSKLCTALQYNNNNNNNKRGPRSPLDTIGTAVEQNVFAPRKIDTVLV